MTKNKNDDSALTRTIIQLIKEKEPESVQQLVELVKEKTSASEQQIMNRILQLQNQGKITFKEKATQPQQSFGTYLKTSAYWYWITITLSIATTLTVFYIPEDAYPIVYVRYVLGSIFVLWLPGYTFIKALFPTQVPIKMPTEDLDSVERIALSIGMSLALVPITGLFLNYTSWGISTTPVTISLLALTIIFATAAVIREHQKMTTTNQTDE
jgi:hypothetical protein